MPTPVTIRPEDPRTTAFRWLVRSLRASPSLGRAVKNWWAWDGTPNTTGELPLNVVTVRLTPRWEEDVPYASNGTNRDFRTDLTVQIEVATPGDHADNPGNLAGLLVSEVDRLVIADQGEKSGVSWVESFTPPQIAGDNPVAVGSVRLAIFQTR